ncbi:hypothetical protein MNV49_002616 [Pseudohyphozyma bogoriensis]|nr:hypothetical protein MNV49_002616 [Pseudohyphozyma bogoriensis]
MSTFRAVQACCPSSVVGARAFSSSTLASTSKLSPLHKTTLKRAERAAKGLGKDAKSKSQSSKVSLVEAAKLLQAFSPTTPNAAYEINIQTKPVSTIQLNALRGRVFLPHSCASSTKSDYIVVFAIGAQAAAARSAGADRVGGEEMIDEILNGQLSPDKLITSTDLSALFTRNPTLARMLGPKGLMPSAKRGTVTDDLATAVQEARGGLDWKGDSRGVVRAAIGRLAFTPEALADNINMLLASVSDISQGGSGTIAAVQASAKRPGITRVLLSSTQGPGIELADV